MKTKMTTKMRISVICYFFPIGAGLLFGLIYILNQDLLGYHIKAMGAAGMDDIPERYVLMLQTFKTAAGLGMLGNAAGMIALLIIQIQKKTVRAKISLFIVAGPIGSLYFSMYSIWREIQLPVRLWCRI